MDDPSLDANGNQDPNDRAQAEAKFAFLTGKDGTWNTGKDRSIILSSFLALSQIDPNLRKALSTLKPPKAPKANLRTQTLDVALETWADQLIDGLSNQIINVNAKGQNSKEVLDRLAVILAEAERNDELWIESMVQESMDTADNKVSSFLHRGSELVSSLASPAAANTITGNIKSILLQSTAGVSSLLTQDAAKQKTAVRSVTGILNTVEHKYLPEMRGRLWSARPRWVPNP
jgi:hypothetical protein